MGQFLFAEGLRAASAERHQGNHVSISCYHPAQNENGVWKMSDLDGAEDGPMEPDEQAQAAKLTAAQLRTIDDCILSNVSHQFRKTARVVALTMGDIGDSFPGLPDIFYSGRIKHLAEAGLIEAAGNLNRMRFSEVRLPGTEQD